MLLQLMLVGAVVAAITSMGINAQAKLDCQDRCGDVSIPYPFGTTEGCYYDQHFLITCNQSFSPPTPFLWSSNITVTNISVDAGQVTAMLPIAHDCYDGSGKRVTHNDSQGSFEQMWLSTTENKFTTIGCDSFSVIIWGNQHDRQYGGGCISVCFEMEYASNGSCTGIGCCQTSIPEGVNNYAVTLVSITNYTNFSSPGHCGYAFVVAKDKFNFSSASVIDLQSRKELPAVLDWVIANETCEVAKNNLTGTYACVDDNSVCQGVGNDTGYRCHCLEGYQGNPYLPGDCQDINECEEERLNKCEIQKLCKNTPGNYTCSCPEGHHGDGRTDGSRCIPDGQSLVLKIVIGVATSVSVLLVAFPWLYLVQKRRKLVKLKEKYFRQNGGFMLEELSRREGSTETTKTFTSEELEKATDNYADSRILGQGGFGTVYKGFLKDLTVAIKKSKIVDQSQITQFINEVMVLSQINHRNVVKLLGCCLETSVPLLVYEYIPNGTLHDHIHNERKASYLSWEIRLTIAAETAGVLSYLHSAASNPIIHRDVKSMNILLDNNYTAKVSDFGASRLIPPGEMQLSTIVQGTLGYLDPEYLQTNQLTEKSDVYSFGVVLVELLTGKKVLRFDGPEEDRSLVSFFLLSLREDRLFEILDKCVVEEGNTEQLKEVANLAKGCLRVKGEERPTMKEVAMELEGARMIGKQYPHINDDYETEHLLGVTSESSIFGGSSNTTNVYDSIREHIVLPINDVR